MFNLEVKIVNKFKIESSFKPTGDQPEAIDKLVEGIKKGHKHQTLLGLLALVRPSPWLML